jgi:hypothetical protein
MTAVGTSPRSLSPGLILSPGSSTGAPTGQAVPTFQSSAPRQFIQRPPICWATTITAHLHRAKPPRQRGPLPLTLPKRSRPFIPQAEQLFGTPLAHAPTTGRSLGGFLQTLAKASSITLLVSDGMKGGGAMAGEEVVVKVRAPARLRLVLFWLCRVEEALELVLEPGSKLLLRMRISVLKWSHLGPTCSRHLSPHKTWIETGFRSMMEALS